MTDPPAIYLLMIKEEVVKVCKKGEMKISQSPLLS